MTGGLAANAPLALVAWKGQKSIAVMVDKAECLQIVDKLESALKRGQGAEATGAAGAQ